MQRYPTVVLHHQTANGSHYDWLLLDPQCPTQLLGFRMSLCSRHWHLKGCWELLRRPPHRRRYLTYQGRIGGGRGSVIRVDQGWFIPLRWHMDSWYLALRLEHADQIDRLRVACCNQDHWRASLA